MTKTALIGNAAECQTVAGCFEVDTLAFLGLLRAVLRLQGRHCQILSVVGDS
jgi:hypothetical protein